MLRKHNVVDGSSKCGSCQQVMCTFLPPQPENAIRVKHALKRGDRLDANEGNACLKFWIVVHGTAASCTSFADGRRQIVSLETKGETICSLMAGPGTQNWLEALSDCLICEIDLGTRAKELHADPAFLALSFHVVHRRLERSQSHLTTLGRLDSVERVTLFLAEMAARAGATLETQPVVSLPMSREDIADYLGLNSETVSRILSRLKKSKLVKFLSPSEFIIPDLAELDRRLPVAIPTPQVYRSEVVPGGPSILHEVPK
ncbi:Crp/Fnr family transcriptional regulator [Aliiruegeria lutimaris]|uniref:CRP/FNR family transcriptional regulator, nitrogen fixation regulation protein n=1 Tax=Aliiruegeria lutimaris TaxID=571298 RepID=A0A1G9D1Y3_9RHOB|nr:Crp/Fnr family transcriptional regulator [Aliiruegeria lutimaris]SDK57694.1 CRP/FNR family transcriptional regulator, nitrogen fixation regulation protein [Aliiruegeria lutimaris]